MGEREKETEKEEKAVVYRKSQNYFTKNHF
jgi:hypothetical protein